LNSNLHRLIGLAKIHFSVEKTAPLNA